MASYGFREERTVRMEPGPDGQLVPHVYIEKRPLTEKEAQEILSEQSKIFSSFDGLFSNMDGFFSSFDGVFKTMEKSFETFLKKNDEDKMGRRS